MSLRAAMPADTGRMREWDREESVFGSDPDESGEWDWAVELARDPDWRDHLIAELDGEPIGFVQIIDAALEESRYWGEIEPHVRAIDIWIGEPRYRNQGHGTRMMRIALARCFADPRVNTVLIDPLVSNVGAHRFYQRLGFRPVGRRRFDGDAEDCLVHRLDRADWNP